MQKYLPHLTAGDFMIVLVVVLGAFGMWLGNARTGRDAHRTSNEQPERKPWTQRDQIDAYRRRWGRGPE